MPRTLRIVLQLSDSLERGPLRSVAPCSRIDPVLFNSLVSTLDKELEGVFTMFADDTELGRTGNNVDDRIRIEHDLERAKCW